MESTELHYSVIHGYNKKVTVILMETIEGTVQVAHSLVLNFCCCSSIITFIIIIIIIIIIIQYCAGMT